MKKYALMLIAVLLICGTVWAQTGDPLMGFNAFEPESIESQFSRGRFSTDIEDYIDATFYNPEIGNFVFVGGGVDTGNGRDYAISFGYGKTLGKNYLGLYYAGHIFNTLAEGYADGTGVYTEDATWKNNLALLFGTGGMGIRFDMIMDNYNVHTVRVDGEFAKQQQTITNAPSIALTWGTSNMGNIYPWVTLGFQFPDMAITTDDDKKMTELDSSVIGLIIGFWTPVKETGSALVEFQAGFAFPKGAFGDVKDITNAPGWAGDPYDDPYFEDGALGFNLFARYTRNYSLGEYTTLKISPKVNLSLTSNFNNNTAIDDKYPSANVFGISPGVDVAAEYRYQKVGLYTGFGLNFLNFTGSWEFGGDDENKAGDNSWEVLGIVWDDNNPIGATIGFGLTFFPIEGLSIGTGIGLNIFNVERMQLVNTGAGTQFSTYNSYTDWFGATLAITLSYQW